MSKTVTPRFPITISLRSEDYRMVEAAREESGLTRTDMILNAVKAFAANARRDEAK